MAKCPYCAKEAAGWATACPRCGREWERVPEEKGAQQAPGVGRRPQLGRPWRFSAFEVPTPAAGPRLGEANDYVLRELLGLGEAEIATMTQQGIIGTIPSDAPVPIPVPVAEQLRLGRLVELDPHYCARLNIEIDPQV